MIDNQNKKNGFTLIEVLIALLILSIALTALLKATGDNINATQRLKEKTLSHWVGMQGIAMLQLGLIDTSGKPNISQATTIFNEKWYWRADLKESPIKKIEQITIRVSNKETGPFQNPLIGFRYQS